MRLLGLLAGVTLLAAPGVALADDWRMVIGNVEGDGLRGVDAASIQTAADGHRSARLLVVLNRPVQVSAENSVVYFVVQQEFDCVGRAHRVHELRAYSPDHTLITTLPPRDAFEPVEADTVDGLTLRSVCDGDGLGDGPGFDTVALALAYARERLAAATGGSK